MDLMSQQQYALFFLTPLCSCLDTGVQIIVPSFTTLLSATTAQVLGDIGPVLRSSLLDEVQYDPVFFRGPYALILERPTLFVCNLRMQKKQ